MNQTDWGLLALYALAAAIVAAVLYLTAIAWSY